MRQALKLDSRQASNGVSKDRLRKRSSGQNVKPQEPPKKSPGGNARIQDELRSPPRPGGGQSISVSLRERTRDLTRKLSFLKRSEEATSPDFLPIQKVPSNQISPKTTGVSSPASDWRLTHGVSPETNAASSKGITTQVKSSKAVIDPHNLDGARFVFPADTSSPATYTTPDNSRPSTSPSAISSNGTTVVLAIDGLAEKEATSSHPLVERLRADTQPTNTSPGALSNKPILIDLPLRHYRSQEDVRQASSQSITREKSPLGLARSSSLREDADSKPASPVTGSSVYSPEGTGYNRPRGSESSVGSPDPSLSLYSLSPNNIMLSPPPVNSSAAPSPLRVRLLEDLSPDAAPIDFAHLPLPSLSPTSSSVPSTIIPFKDSPAKSISTSSSTPSNDLTKQIPTSAGAPSSSPLSNSSINVSPLTTHHIVPTAFRSAPNPSNPTFSVFPRSASGPGAAVPPTTNTIKEEPLLSGVLTSPPPSRGYPTNNKPNGISISRPSTANGTKTSPWRKVFGSSKSNGVVISPTANLPSLEPSKSNPVSSKGHRKSKSGGGIIIVPQDRLEKEREKQRRRAGSFGDSIGKAAGGAESGFMGMGKDGIWISRKNFLKT